MKEKTFKAKSIQPFNPNELDISPELLEIQEFMPISVEDRARLKKDIETSGEVRDPVKVYFNKNGDAQILGGKNRWEIVKELGWQFIPVEVYDLPPKQRKELALMDNLARRHLTREQKNRIVEMFLKTDPAQSDRVISKKAGTDHKTVGAVRSKLAATGEIPRLKKRQGADGKARTASPSRPTPKPAAREEFRMPAPLDEGDFVLTDKGYVPEGGKPGKPAKTTHGKRDKAWETKLKEQLVVYLKTLSSIDREAVREDLVRYINTKTLN